MIAVNRLIDANESIQIVSTNDSFLSLLGSPINLFFRDDLVDDDEFLERFTLKFQLAITGAFCVPKRTDVTS